MSGAKVTDSLTCSSHVCQIHPACFSDSVYTYVFINVSKLQPYAVVSIAIALDIISHAANPSDTQQAFMYLTQN